MRRMFFLLSSMNVGGVEKAFLGLLSTISLEENEVHVGLVKRSGGLLGQLPKEVHIHDVNVYHQYWRLINDPPLWNIKALIRQWRCWEALVHLLLYVHFKLTGSRLLFYRYLLRNEPMMAETFDVAVAFAGPSQMIDYYICNKVRAKEKYGWVHFDISRFGIDVGMTRILYRNYKKIFIVSNAAKKVFDEKFPEFKDKTEVRYNIVSKEQVMRLAKEGTSFADYFTGKRILTVGRVSEEKGQREALKALRLLIDKGYNVRWYFVGGGKDLAYCESMARELGLESNAVFLGEQLNPYAYMQDCDIYVQPSRHEGFCITLAEALCFNMPIVCTDFTGAREQLDLYPNSRVTDMDAESIAKGIEDFV